MIKPIYFNVQDRTQALAEPRTTEDRLNNEIAVLRAEVDELEEAAQQANAAAKAKSGELQRLLRIQG
jgi:septal ring factor EnvC (AmiA/AmiB activator)